MNAPDHSFFNASQPDVSHLTAELRQVITSSTAPAHAIERMRSLLEGIESEFASLQANLEKARLDNFREWVDQSLLADDGRKQSQLRKLAQSLASALPQEQVQEILNGVYEADEQDVALASLLQVDDPELAGPSFCEVAEDIESLADARLRAQQGGYGSLQIAASTLRALSRNQAGVNRLCSLAAGLRTASIDELPFLSEQFRLTAAASVFKPPTVLPAGG